MPAQTCWNISHHLWPSCSEQEHRARYNRIHVRGCSMGAIPPSMAECAYAALLHAAGDGTQPAAAAL